MFERQPVVAVAIDKDKASHWALKWTLDNLVRRGQTVLLVHVLASFSPSQSGNALSSLLSLLLSHRPYI